MNRFRRTVLFRHLILVTLLVLLLTPTALAATPTPALIPPPPPDAICATSPHGTVCHFDGAFHIEIPELVVCSNFVVDAVSNSMAGFRRAYDETGTLVNETRHIRFEGTLTNRATGLSMIYAGSFNVTLDIATQTATVTGGQGRLLLPDGGVDVVLAGRVVTDLSLDPPLDIFVAGPKDFDTKVCTYLA